MGKIRAFYPRFEAVEFLKTEPLHDTPVLEQNEISEEENFEA